MACLSFSHYAEAPLVVVVLQEDPRDHFEFDFLVVPVPLVYLPVVLLLVPLVLVHLRVYFHFPFVEHARGNNGTIGPNSGGLGDS